MSKLPVPVELLDTELDAVAGGALVSGNIGGGLITVQANDVIDIGDVNVLNNSLNNNEVVKNVGVGIGVAAGILGNAGALGAGQGRG